MYTLKLVLCTVDYVTSRKDVYCLYTAGTWLIFRDEMGEKVECITKYFGCYIAVLCKCARINHISYC